MRLFWLVCLVLFSCSSKEPPPGPRRSEQLAPKAPITSNLLLVRALEAMDNQPEKAASLVKEAVALEPSEPVLYLGSAICRKIDKCAKVTQQLEQDPSKNVFALWHLWVDMDDDDAQELLGRLAERVDASLYWSDLTIRLTKAQMVENAPPKEALTRATGWLAQLLVPNFSLLLQACKTPSESCQKVTQALLGGDELVEVAVGIALAQKLGIKAASSEDWRRKQEQCARVMARASENVQQYLNTLKDAGSERAACEVLQQVDVESSD